MAVLNTLPESVSESRAYQILERSLEQGRLSHAILLHGESLKILSQVAENIAGKLLQSETPFEHPDCFICRPRGKARLITIGQGSEKVDGQFPQGTVRRLVVDMAKSSNQGGHKVGILHEADCITTPATNAFLKTLEEPPPRTTLFLLTTRPYNLLDTIRSRCFNFRVTTTSEAIAHPQWAKWLADYREWLTLLIKGPNKQSIPHIMMATYGLNVRFQQISDELSTEEWNQIKATMPDHLNDKDVDAAKTGVFKTFRGQLLGEIEKATSRFARDLEKANPGRLPATALQRATESLEKSAGLLELNFNQAASLERFFLTSLRIWTAAR
jgi:DNA polymerase-3 subunit delta'